jgi:hypothetical protein
MIHLLTSIKNISFFKVLSLWIALIVFTPSLSFAQTFERKVFSTAGKDVSNGQTGLAQYRMAYTIGEPLIYGGTAGTNKISNGFIQPIGITAVAPPSSTSSGMILQPGDIAVYPNPFGTYLMINGWEESEEKVNVQLIDQQGKLILQKDIVPHNYQLEIPAQCAPGIYLLNMYTLNGQFIQQNRLIKMTIENN